MGLKHGRPSGRTKKHVADEVTKLENESRLTILLPASMKKKLKLKALEQETDVSKLVREAIAKIIK